MIFPIAVADFVKDFDDPLWQMILHLRQVCCLVCAPAISFNQIEQLKAEIDYFIQLRQQCFPSKRLRPKYEFMLHFPELIPQFGPLKHLWTLRCESKHRYFKNIMKSSQNFKNVSQMLAEKHELLQCSLENQFESVIELSNPVDYKLQKYDDLTVDLINEFNEKNHSSIKYVCKKVCFKGIEYKENMSICVDKNLYGNLVICKIKFILIRSDYTVIYFLRNTHEIIYNTHIGVYELAQYNDHTCRSKSVAIFPHSNLSSADPLCESIIKCTPIYVMKYTPFYADE